MCFPALLAAIPALASLGGGAAAGAAGVAAGTAGTLAGAGTFLGLQAGTWSTISTVASLAGTAVGAVGSILQGNAQEKAAGYQADLQRQQALDAKRRGSIAEGEQRTRTAQLIGKQRAAMGASGIVADEGSFGDLLAQSAEYGERDAQRLRANASREAWGLRTQAGLTEFQGQQAGQMGLWGAGTSLLTGVGNLFSRAPYWQRWQGEPIT